MPTIPLHIASTLTRRDGSSNWVPGQGAKPPTDFNNQAFLALFATLGGLMVLASLWFFFWAKNGGFVWQEGDWDDYKSTVLRRKGPDGKTLSNATKSTKLGGASIAGTQKYQWARQQARSVVSYDEKGRKGILGKRGWGGSHSVYYSDDITESQATETVSDMTEVRGEADYRSDHSKRYRDRDVREYKKERPARVGGLNRVADGSGIGSTINGSDLSSQTSETPVLQSQKNKEREQAERRAREEAAKMERRWKREAEEAAAALARESARSIPQPKKAAMPSSSKNTPPSPPKHRQSSRSTSPKKRETSYNYNAGAASAASDVLSTVYSGTQSSGTRSASYYEAYRPHAASHSRGESKYTPSRSRQSSPPKKASTRASGGYRRGADSDLD